MGNMMDDINKFAAMWDQALAQGVFQGETPEETQSVTGFGSDFFGQNLSDTYDMDKPINESEINHWEEIAGLAGNYRKKIVNEAAKDDRKKNSKKSEKIANDHNPQHFQYLGKDGKSRVSQNWGVGGKEHFDLEKLKKDLHSLEDKLAELDEKKQNQLEEKIKKIKKQIDDLSDSLSGNKMDVEG